jgi:hypothetical protein
MKKTYEESIAEEEKLQRGDKVLYKPHQSETPRNAASLLNVQCCVSSVDPRTGGLTLLTEYGRLASKGKSGKLLAKIFDSYQCTKLKANTTLCSTKLEEIGRCISNSPQDRVPEEDALVTVMQYILNVQPTIIRCRCKGICKTKKCICRKKSIPCTRACACKCGQCTNRVGIGVDEQDDDEE